MFIRQRIVPLDCRSDESLLVCGAAEYARKDQYSATSSSSWFCADKSFDRHKIEPESSLHQKVLVYGSAMLRRALIGFGRGAAIILVIVTLVSGMCWNVGGDHHEDHQGSGGDTHLCFSCVCHQVIPPVPITVAEQISVRVVAWEPAKIELLDEFIADIDPPPVKRS